MTGAINAEIRLPVSPNEQYGRMVRCFLASLRQRGGSIARQARVVLSVSRDQPRCDLRRYWTWLDRENVTVRWINEDLFSEEEYDGTGLDRYWVESDADVVAMMDADMLVVDNFDHLFVRAHEEQKHLGFVAHVSPFHGSSFAGMDALGWWRRVLRAADLELPQELFQHTGWGLMDHDPARRMTPIYFNYGVVVSPRIQVEKLARMMWSDIRLVRSIADTWFRSQIALTIGLLRSGIAWDTISINDNFPLHVDAEAIRRLNTRPGETLDDRSIRIFHYLGNGEINKAHFASESAYRKLINGGVARSATGRRFVDELIRVSEDLRVPGA